MLRLILCAATIAAALASTTLAADPDWQPLFDGKSIDGWVKRGGGATYQVEDGAIVGTTVPNTPNTFLCTPREYADFELELEFKVDPKLNSGVQIRSNSVPGYKDGIVHGYQVEIDPSERAFTGGIYDEGRRAWLQDLSKNEKARQALKQNEWNKLRIEARGDTLRTWVNDVPAADLKDDLTHSGFIALQVHGTDSKEPLEVRWRNLRIKDHGDPWKTPPDKAVVLLGPKGDTSAWEHFGKPGSKIEWAWTGDALEIKPGSGNIVTREKFGDTRIHIEFAVDNNEKEGQGNGNSGVYVQGRYEVQILNSAGKPPADDLCGGIYKVAVPEFAMARPAGEWQSYDMWFTAARFDKDGKKTANAKITVYHNGTRIHKDVELPEQTGAGAPETPEPGPLMLQDHGNKIRFRNIWVAPVKSTNESPR